jgi:hypothetical protein
MKTTLAIAAVAALAFGSPAWSQCEISPTVDASTTTPQSLEIRNALFKKLCEDSGGLLIDGDDKLIRARLVWPSGIRRYDSYSNRPIPNGSAVVAYIVRANGVVKWAAVLESTGQKDYKSFALTSLQGKKLGPATLDGKPVEVFLTATSSFGPQK